LNTIQNLHLAARDVKCCIVTDFDQYKYEEKEKGEPIRN